jgi:1,4-dihydroxy-2-naphthoate octaprenyltransferase
MGRETIPILLGATKTRKMLNYLLLLLAFLLLILGLTGLTPKVAFLLTINIGVYYLLFAFLVERHLIDRLFLEALTDGNFVLAGMISATYMLF